jgi:hypothetical protein
MPIEHRYDPELRTLFLELRGTITDAEILDFASEMATSRDVPPGRRELVDLCGVEQADLSSATLRAVAEIYARADERPEESRVAFVAPRDLFFGLARMYEAFRSPSPLQIRVFRELGEARAWLGIPAS